MQGSLLGVMKCLQLSRGDGCITLTLTLQYMNHIVCQKTDFESGKTGHHPAALRLLLFTIPTLTSQRNEQTRKLTPRFSNFRFRQNLREGLFKYKLLAVFPGLQIQQEPKNVHF